MKTSMQLNASKGTIIMNQCNKEDKQVLGNKKRIKKQCIPQQSHTTKYISFFAT